MQGLLLLGLLQLAWLILAVLLLALFEFSQSFMKVEPELLPSLDSVDVNWGLEGFGPRCFVNTNEPPEPEPEPWMLKVLDTPLSNILLLDILVSAVLVLLTIEYAESSEAMDVFW